MLGQGFSASARLTLGLEDPLMRGVLGTAGCGETSLVSTHHMPGARPLQLRQPQTFPDMAECPWWREEAVLN